MDAAAVAGAITRLSAGGRLLVGIDGFGGSGKSTLAEAIAAQLASATVVPIDDFIVKEHVDDDTWELAWDRDRLIAEVLDPFRVGAPIAYRRLLWDQNALSDPIALGEADILIIEGITALHPDLAERYDYRVWVDAPLEIASARGRVRDAGNENATRWDRWALNDRHYFDTYRPDLIVDTIVANG